MPDGWRIETRDGIDLARCDALDSVPGIRHAFSTRRGQGGDDFDIGPADDESAIYRDRRKALARAAGLGAAVPIVLRQVHGAELAVLEPGAWLAEADGVLARRGTYPDLTAAVRVADCVPVLIADRDGRAVAAVHAGWRGTVAGILGQAIASLDRIGVPPACQLVALGPAIGPCCYQVAPDVALQVARSGAEEPRDRTRADLHRTNRRQARQAGIPPGQIHAAPWCTHCAGDLFFSYRREGTAAGRMMACVGWAGAP